LPLDALIEPRWHIGFGSTLCGEVEATRKVTNIFAENNVVTGGHDSSYDIVADAAR
jgi:hypothetical protein